MLLRIESDSEPPIRIVCWRLADDVVDHDPTGVAQRCYAAAVGAVANLHRGFAPHFAGEVSIRPSRMISYIRTPDVLSNRTM